MILEKTEDAKIAIALFKSGESAKKIADHIGQRPDAVRNFLRIYFGKDIFTEKFQDKMIANRFYSKLERADVEILETLIQDQKKIRKKIMKTLNCSYIKAVKVHKYLLISIGEKNNGDK